MFENGISYIQTEHMNYLEVPFNLLFRTGYWKDTIQFPEKLRVFGFFGPKLCFGLSGSDNGNGESLDVFSSAVNYSRFVLNIEFGGGVQIKRVMINTFLNFDLTSIQNNSELNGTVKYHEIGLAITYFLGK